MTLIETSRALAARVERLSFAPPVSFVYNPLIYAREPHERYLARYGAAPREVLLVGMNPGPFGMAQTGVPFGDVTMVRDWLGITGDVGHPAREHPKRPVQGFACGRSEVSGTRLWGWARARFGTAAHFFERFFVTNYCPLAFLEESGRNRTPDKLPPAEKEAVFEACDEALREVVTLLQPKVVVGVGAFAERRAKLALAEHSCDVGGILHPSPASPAANSGWSEVVERQLEALGIALPTCVASCCAV
jgi:single-strand selective monofunctional uracil DNA glycosylase